MLTFLIPLALIVLGTVLALALGRAAAQADEIEVYAPMRDEQPIENWNWPAK